MAWFVLGAAVAAAALTWDVSPIAALGFPAIGVIALFCHWRITRPANDEEEIDVPGHGFDAAA